MEPHTLAIIFLVAGFLLLIAEVFIPTGGALGVMVFLSFTASIVFAWKAWGETSSTTFWSFVGGLIVMVPIVAFTAFHFLANSPLGNKVLLTAPKPEEVLPYQDEMDHLSQLVGAVGVAETLLSPGGMVRVNNERLHAFSEGVMINMGEQVEVVAVRGTRVLVRRSTRPVERPMERDSLEPPEDDPFLT